jgi:phage terminase large subunit-like protein
VPATTPRDSSPDELPVCGYTHDEKRCRRRGDHRCSPRVAHVLSFFDELLVHAKGRWARRTFRPARWQRERVLAPLFGEVVWSDFHGGYVRRYRTLYLLVPRKNGKSTLLAGICLYLLCADGEDGAEVYGLALDRDQAGYVFSSAMAMVRLSPTLSARLNVLPSRERIVDPARFGSFSIMAGDDDGALGSTPHGAYIDELLTQPNRNLYDAIRTGMGTRAQPLLMLATTAESDPNGFAASERAWSEQVAQRPELEPTRLVVMYAAPADSDWTDERTWRTANPALGDFLDPAQLRAEFNKAHANPAEERAFRQFRLNQPVRAIGRAIDLAAWDGCAGPRADEADLAGRRAFGGLDLASSSDLAAVAWAFPGADGEVSIVWRHFAPESALHDLDRRTAGNASAWADAGWLTVTPGNVIDYRAIVAAIEADRARFDVVEVAYDRWGMTQLAQDLMDAGLSIIQFGQGFASMSAPTRELLRKVAAGQLVHLGDPLARWEASNLVTRTDPAGNLKPDKERSADKVDGMVAAVMALDRAVRYEPPAPSPQYRVAGF